MLKRFRKEQAKIDSGKTHEIIVHDKAVNAGENNGEENLDPKAMSIFEHIAELRTRLVRSLIGIAVFFFLTLAFGEYLINYLKGPLVSALPKGSDALHFTDPFDVFTVYIKIGVLGGIVLGSPVWLYQFWRFVEPALYPKERKNIIPFSIASAVLFITGVAFCYFYVLPLALQYLITLGGANVKPIIAIGPYFSMLILMVFGFGLVFEAPLVLILLAMLDLIDVDTLRKNRRMTVVIIFIVAAIATPPDPISQIALAVPMYIMYEASILIIAIMKKKQAATTEKQS